MRQGGVMDEWEVYFVPHGVVHRRMTRRLRYSGWAPHAALVAAPGWAMLRALALRPGPCTCLPESVRFRWQVLCDDQSDA